MCLFSLNEKRICFCSGYENNFNKYKTDRIDSMGSKYDYKSLMHYGSAYFKKSDGLITIRTKNPKMQNVIGQRGGFSEGNNSETS